MTSTRMNTAAMMAIVLVLLAPCALAQAPLAELKGSVDGGSPFKVYITAVIGADGTSVYAASIPQLGGSMTISCNVTVDWKNDPLTSIIGALTVVNNSASAQSVSCAFLVPLCPKITNGSLLGGVVKMVLTTSGPGTLQTVGGTPMIQVLCNGAVAQSLFLWPFSLSASGSSEMSATKSFGLPSVGSPGPAMVQTFGVRQLCSITSMDVASAQFTLMALDADGVTPNPCPADLNGNGVVEAGDLGLLFAQWGQSSFCPAELLGDLDGNGVVGGTDFGMLMAAWGPC